jgi:hypothetical protein
MEEAPENSNESSHSVHANGMNESMMAINKWLQVLLNCICYYLFINPSRQKKNLTLGYKVYASYEISINATFYTKM